jgi:hypothetical protein
MDNNWLLANNPKSFKLEIINKDVVTSGGEEVTSGGVPVTSGYTYTEVYSRVMADWGNANPRSFIIATDVSGIGFRFTVIGTKDSLAGNNFHSAIGSLNLSGYIDENS